MIMPPRNLSANSRITIAIAEDDAAVRDALKELLASEGHLDLVGVAADADEAIRLCRRLQPKVILVDLRMPRGGGIRAIEEIRRASRSTHCIALTAYEDRGSILSAIEAGADSYIVKGAAVESVLSTIGEVIDGQTRLAPEIAGRVIHELGDMLRHETRDVDEKDSLRARVRQAMSTGAMTVMHQAVRRLEDTAAIGYEALARFRSDAELSTREWFDAAESVGLGRDLEYAAADLAVANLSSLPPDCWLGFNLTPAHISDTHISSLLAMAPADRLVVEITEQVPIDDYTTVRAELAVFRQRGGRIAVDDAGSGYSSLQHILELEPDFIKLDISLTKDIERKAKQRAVVTSLVALAEAVEAVVIAEGIETVAQLNALRDLGVKHGQGFLLGRPACLDRRDRPGARPAEAS